MPPNSAAPRHDIKRQLRDLNEALSQEKRPLAILLGAGCPVSIRVSDGQGGMGPLIPDVAGLTDRVAAHLAGDAHFQVLLGHFAEDAKENANIEHMLTQVRNLKRVVGASSARGLDGAALAQLETKICAMVAKETSKLLPTTVTPYHRLARWIRSIERSHAVTIFTTNYDVLAEQAFEEEDVPFFDGFSGSHRPFFDLRAIEEDALPLRWTRLWKLHGSVTWRIGTEPRRAVYRAGLNDDMPGDLLIHPSELKYDQSRRMPYLAMFDRLRAFLRQPAALLVTCGYSFVDEHINEALVEGLAANPSAATFGLLFKKLAEERGAVALASRVPRNLSLLSADRAVIRQVEADWWDPDAQQQQPPAVTNSGSSPPCGFGLGDFEAFGTFLSRLAAAAGPAGGA